METNREKWPYLWKKPTNLPLALWVKDKLESTKSWTENALKWENPVFEDIKKTLADWKISFNWWWWSVWPIWIIWELINLNREELIETCHRLKESIQNRNPRHDTDIYRQVSWAIEERLISLWINYELIKITYKELWHNKSIEIPMPTK